MFEINKADFGGFVQMLRKEKGYSQKELAEKLMVSDKAVSKWETGHSLPDITLLIPLSDILDVTVTELLECRRIENAVDLTPEDVEALVKTAITFSEPDENRKREIKGKRLFIYLGTVGVFAVELVILYFLRFKGANWLNSGMLLCSGMSLGFGGYFWLLSRDRLPSYYDENKISAYYDGPFRMNMPGVYFNNRNWKHIINGLRWWSSISAVLYPVLSLIGNLLLREAWELTGWVLTIPMMVSLFTVIYRQGKKYQ